MALAGLGEELTYKIRTARPKRREPAAHATSAQVAISASEVADQQLIARLASLGPLTHAAKDGHWTPWTPWFGIHVQLALFAHPRSSGEEFPFAFFFWAFLLAGGLQEPAASRGRPPPQQPQHPIGRGLSAAAAGRVWEGPKTAPV